MECRSYGELRHAALRPGPERLHLSGLLTDAGFGVATWHTDAKPTLIRVHTATIDGPAALEGK